MPNEEKTEDVEPATTPASTPPQLTTDAVKAALRRAAPGANELHQKLRELFTLTDASATLRLR